MNKEIVYKGHTITAIPQGTAYSVRVSGPIVNSRAGVFATDEGAIDYGKTSVDKASGAT